MKTAVIFGAAAAALFAAYLALWPVPIDPAPWDAPKDAGYTGVFAPNEKLANLERLPIGGTYGPEDVAVMQTEGGFRIFTVGHKGEILEIDPANKTARLIANTGGVPLGIEAGSDGMIYVADSHKGLLSVSPSGEFTVLTDSAEGIPIAYADDLDIAPNGVIYVSDASTKFGAEAIGSTMHASLLEILEQGKTGRLLAYDPRDKTTQVVASGFSFANGVAMAADGLSVLVNETGTYQTHRIYIEGPRKGEKVTVLENLPGFPDNINDLPDGTFLLGLISKRSKWLDKNSQNPAARKIALRLPPALRAKSESYGFIIHLSAEGKILETWQDPSGDYPQATGAMIAPDGYMYVSSLTAPQLARLKLP